MTQHTFGEISDDIPTKYHLPLGTNIWELFKEMGWEWLKFFFTEFGKSIYELSSIRLNESIYTAQDVIQGKIPEWQADKILTYAFFPPVLTVRADLQQGLMKLLFGESVDTTFVFLHDFDDGECVFALNTHMEDGIPVDWWLINRDDEFFNRRHIKLGIKLKDIPRKSKNLDQAAKRIISTLYDARNERTPDWSKSAYYLILIWSSAGLNMILESSSFEVIGYMFDGIVSKFAYGLKDFWFNFWPIPPMLRTYLHTNINYRKKFMDMMGGLFTENRLYLQPIEQEARPLVRDLIPESLEFIQNKWDQKGMLMPYQSIGRILPNLRDKKIFQNANKNPKLLEPNFPDDPESRFRLEDLELTFEEILDGAYLDLTIESKKENISPDIIISRKHGRNTEFLWDEYITRFSQKNEK